ncbi:unnamed protein product [Trifolium pratense]|uniref:Uncharacterized protein n=1 Tax=Trifolium pratense TaxID=57577 RepID=A0ACB0LMK4_TRIPR|nr:unnamed protein product [Trifolium pratense]
MVPSQSNKQNYKTINGDYVFYNNNTTTSAMNQFQFVEDYNNYNNCLRSEFLLRHMAEEEESSSRLNTITTTHHNESEHELEPEPETISTSKEEEEQEQNNSNNNNNWLQLSIGNTVLTTTSKHDRDHNQAPTTSSGLLELDLLPTNWTSSRPNLEQPSIRGCSTFNSSLFLEQTTSSSSSSSMSISMSMPSGPTYGHQQQQHQHLVPHNWAFGPLHLPHSMAIMHSSTSYIPSLSSSSQSCSSLRPSLGPNYYPQYHHASPFYFPSSSSSSSGFDQFDVAGPSSSSHIAFRVVDPPRRPHSGIWFMLQASQNQVKEPCLPQIPKNYLRIKDGRMTVRLLLKYLVSKLKLESESEIEITCRGQQLLPFLTLQHVRDNIWTPRDTTTRPLLSDSSTADHVMVLHYGRSTS